MDSSPLTILVVHNHYQQRGGEDSVFETECTMLESAGHTVICYEKHNDEIGTGKIATKGHKTPQEKDLGLNTEAQRHREESVSTTERTEVSERVARQSENSNLKSRIVSQTLCASPSLCLKTNSAQPPSPSPSPSVLSVSSVVKKTFFPFVLFVSFVVKKTRHLCSHLSLFVKTIWNRTTYREITEIIQREKPDIVHCHNTFPLISPSIYWAAAKQGVPVVQTLHNYRLICINPYLYRNGKICEDCLGHSPIPGIIHRCYRDSLSASFTVATMLMIHRILGTYRNKVTTYIALTEFGRNKFLEAKLCSPTRVVVKPNAIAAPSAAESTDLSQSERGLGCPQPELSSQLSALSSNLDPLAPSPKLGPKAYGLKPEIPTVLYVGRLSPEKGVDVLIRAWKIFIDRWVAEQGTDFATKKNDNEPTDQDLGNSVHGLDGQNDRSNSPAAQLMPRAYSLKPKALPRLHIIGDGPERQNLESITTEIPSISFLGLQPQLAVRQHMAQASVLVFPSVWYETFGLTILEAAALGTPSIVSDIGGQSSLVEDGLSGYKFRSGDVEALAKTIFEALVDSGQLESRARKAKIQIFAGESPPEKNVIALCQIYRDLCYTSP